MKVLAVASEVYPLIKTGGLADVVGALPGALKPQGIEVKTLVPGYPAVTQTLENPQAVFHFDNLYGGVADVISARAKGLDVLVLDAPHLFARPGNPYMGPGGTDWPDNGARYAALSQVAGHLARGGVPQLSFDLVHMHDWQAGLTAAYLKYLGGPPSVMTIHNLAFQGQFPASMFSLLGLPSQAFTMDGVEYYGGVGYLKAGLALAHAVSTVSPTYAREIQTPEDGMGLDGLLRFRTKELHGILNGIDTDIWNPETDASLAKNFSTKNPAGRSENKRAIEKRFQLQSDDSLLFSIVSRITGQKGMDLVAAAADRLVASGARLAILGSGDAGLESQLKAAASRHSGRIGIVTGYDEGLSHLMQGGCDCILIPSRFEPCGLTQLYGLRYGCVPLVSRVGGLADSVIDANEAAVNSGTATGIVFAPVTQLAFEHALDRAVALYNDKPTWSALQATGMQSKVDWSNSAARYAKLFRSLKSK
jgi:starch synthase